MSISAGFDTEGFGERFKYLVGWSGGEDDKTSSRNSSILFTSVLISLLKVVMVGGSLKSSFAGARASFLGQWL